jgi:hypothetical protein
MPGQFVLGLVEMPVTWSRYSAEDSDDDNQDQPAACQTADRPRLKLVLTAPLHHSIAHHVEPAQDAVEPVEVDRQNGRKYDSPPGPPDWAMQSWLDGPGSLTLAFGDRGRCWSRTRSP